MRFKVPQNIDMQDRILGPLTMLQFIYAVIGGGATYVCYMSLPSPLSILLALIVALFTLAMIFLKINERPFSHFLLSLIKFMSTPKQRIWHKGQTSDINVEIYHTQKKNQGPVVAEKHLTREQIAQYAKGVDTPDATKI